jgi:hypothetical protein
MQRPLVPRPGGGARGTTATTTIAVSAPVAAPSPGPDSVLAQAIGRLNSTTVAPDGTRPPGLSVATPAIPVPMFDKDVPQDPIALAERLENQRFTDEALDMVSASLRTLVVLVLTALPPGTPCSTNQ